ncbi:alpha/beta hydrolase [Humisphaera borealis]|uniref:Alpha/beta hydrolase n=1 Tax=Humisphaera borealis TaxID=2807512 RepID=A0A7M2WWS0_9BACT|nr:alpha/beta hydrolase [Humisphaera borealis]QOV89652.1 alpha/beta hydrolase [Humisphaera borealis]
MPTQDHLLAGLYVALPLVGGVVAVVFARRRRNFKPVVAFGLSLVSALLISLAICLFYARGLSAEATAGQILLTAYLLTGVLVLLKALSWFLKEAAERAFFVHISQSAGRPTLRHRNGPPVDAAGTEAHIDYQHPRRPAPPARGIGWAARLAGATLTRVVLLFAIGLPYVMSLGMIYRPKVVGGQTPLQQLGTPFVDVSFEATDGTTLAGWWIPALPPPPTGPNPASRRSTPPATARATSRPDDWGRKTVVICHGLGSSKSNQLALARDLVVNGYNVLAFDFRAHGSSGGQLCSFGDRERFDVLGAVRWLRLHRPDEAQRIVGLGVSMGGAALLAAAGDDSAEGRAIDAVSVFSTYADFASLADDITDNYLISPLGWLARNIGVPLASAHVGTDLQAFSPSRATDRLAPRPIMVVHGRGDHLIPFETGVRLFERAQLPKVRLWVGELDAENRYVIRSNAKYTVDETGVQRPLAPSGPSADHINLIYYDDALKAVRLFFEEARAMS